MNTFLSKEHPITEKGMMEFQPFGKERDGTAIRDISGVVIRALVEYLEESESQRHGQEAGRRAVEELVRRLNERIPERAFYVTEGFIKNTWNSYSNEFGVFLTQFCWDISGDSQFQFNMAREKAISPVIQVLGRPLSVPQIYKMSAYFAQRFAKDSFYTEAVEVSEGAAIIQMRLSDRALRQFGPYLRSCAEMYCIAHKGYFAGVPEKFHNMSPATVEDRRCIAEGDDYCEWVVTWSGHERGGPLRRGAVSVARRIIRSEIEQKERVVAEQIRTLDARHVELQEAYVQQQQTTAELKRLVDELTILHETGLVFTSILDPEALLDKVLHTIVYKLRYDRAMITFFDRARLVSHDARVLGVSPEIAEFARKMEIPVTDSESVEGTVLLKGEPVLLNDIQQAWDRLHPFNQQLAQAVQAKSVISVPLKVKNEVLGALTVDRTGEHLLTQDDLKLIGTLASQVAIALDNARAYQQLGQLTQTLEQRVQHRTQLLLEANRRLQELDKLKSDFVSTVSHELRTPMTSIKGYVDNILDGLTGALTERQSYYLNRVKYNVERLTRMINDLLDLSRIEAGKVELHLSAVCMRDLVNDVVEGFQRAAQEKGLTLRSHQPDELPAIRGDRDKLHQVLTNLIQNAIKFTPKGGEIRVEANAHDGGFVLVSVSDTGCGIPPHELDRVFDRFYRVESVSAEECGSGLGLPIAKSLVELHGGRIWAESTPGQGSRFYFTVPIAPPTR
ncbi:MAG: hypothetical protein AUI36_24510 [Cyanobacteria bacterium 13_1_40CM_2_61_4]|nr:MAG: hypothetical protein AUI36_24510 [Cyanobacteria bacterium 13_1_40CM_2_61_4]